MLGIIYICIYRVGVASDDPVDGQVCDGQRVICPGDLRWSSSTTPNNPKLCGYCRTPGATKEVQGEKALHSDARVDAFVALLMSPASAAVPVQSTSRTAASEARSRSTSNVHATPIRLPIFNRRRQLFLTIFRTAPHHTHHHHSDAHLRIYS